MRKYCVLVLMLLFALITCVAEGYIRPYAQTSTVEVAWWVRKKFQVENIDLVDHLGSTNQCRRPIGGGTDNVTAKSRFGHGTAVISPDLQIISYTVDHAYIDRGWTTNNVAPGTYDLVNGTWYGDMTGEEKTAMWVAYTNKVAQERAAAEARKNAPAKFDVSKTPEEYKAYLLNGREEDDIDPVERRFITREVRKYEDEWTRINEPEKWSLPDPELLNINKMSEQKKKNSFWFRSRRRRR